MIYHKSEIWTLALAPCQTHYHYLYLPIKSTSTDSNFVNVLQVSFLNQYDFGYLSLFRLDIFWGPKALDWTENVGGNGQQNLRIDRIWWIFSLVF